MNGATKQRIGRVIAIYGLAILIGVLFTINSAALACSAAFIQTDWITLTKTQKFTLVCIIIGNFSNTMLAFFNKTLGRIESGKTAFETGDTAFLTKQATQQTSEKITLGPPPPALGG